MKIFQVAKFYVRKDYGREYCLSFFLTERYSLLQIAFDVGEYSKWNEPPYLQVNMGGGKLFSLFFMISKFGICLDLFGKNWREEYFYIKGTPDELAQDTTNPPVDAL